MKTLSTILITIIIFGILWRLTIYITDILIKVYPPLLQLSILLLFIIGIPLSFFIAIKIQEFIRHHF